MSTLTARASRLRPGWVFAALDLVALLMAVWLFSLDSQDKIPVPQLGIVLAVLLTAVAAAWAATDRDVLGDVHYAGALVGAVFGVVYQVYTQTSDTVIPILIWFVLMAAIVVSTHRLKEIHPGLILASLDIVGLLIASYLSYDELGGGTPSCGVLHGCEAVANSPYAKIAGIPVAVFGVALSLILLSLAIAWIRTNNPTLLDLHYGLSLVGVIFELYFISVQALILHQVCIWCASYGLSLIARFLVALVIWLR
ncbi:MAG TPA: vitamin K epoxide reductase family protein, partial [Candidatus Limnocylindrales bacterium]